MFCVILNQGNRCCLRFMRREYLVASCLRMPLRDYCSPVRLTALCRIAARSSLE